MAEQLFFGFTCRNFGPRGAQVEKDREGIKNGGRQKTKKAIWTLLLSLFTDVNNYLSAELSQLLYIVVTICLLIG